MSLYAGFLGAMAILFAGIGLVLLVLAARQAVLRRPREAAIYFALTLLAGSVATGFYLVRGLMSS